MTTTIQIAPNEAFNATLTMPTVLGGGTVVIEGTAVPLLGIPPRPITPPAIQLPASQSVALGGQTVGFLLQLDLATAVVTLKSTVNGTPSPDLATGGNAHQIALYTGTIPTVP